MGVFSKLFGKGEPGNEPAQRAHAAGRRVLLVEPSITVSKVVELTLAGDSIATATTAAAARQAFAQQQPQVVLLAATLPDGDAYELARSFANDTFRACPVILLRGAFEPLDGVKARAAGVTEIVMKPFEPRQLQAAIDRLVS